MTTREHQQHIVAFNSVPEKKASVVTIKRRVHRNALAIELELYNHMKLDLARTTPTITLEDWHHISTHPILTTVAVSPRIIDGEICQMLFQLIGSGLGSENLRFG